MSQGGGQTWGAQGLMQKELRRTAARIWGKTACCRADADSLMDLIGEIHDELVGIEAAFREEITEEWGE